MTPSRVFTPIRLPPETADSFVAAGRAMQEAVEAAVSGFTAFGLAFREARRTVLLLELDETQELILRTGPSVYLLAREARLTRDLVALTAEIQRARRGLLAREVQ